MLTSIAIPWAEKPSPLVCFVFLLPVTTCSAVPLNTETAGGQKQNHFYDIATAIRKESDKNFELLRPIFSSIYINIALLTFQRTTNDGWAS